MEKNQKLQVLRQIIKRTESTQQEMSNFSDGVFLLFNKSTEKVLDDLSLRSLVYIDLNKQDCKFQLETLRNLFSSDDKNTLFICCDEDQNIRCDENLLDNFIKVVFELFKIVNSLDKRINLWLIHVGFSTLSGFIEGLCLSLIQENNRLSYRKFHIEKYSQNTIKEIICKQWDKYSHTLYIDNLGVYEFGYENVDNRNTNFDKNIFKDKVVIITGQGEIALNLSDYLTNKYNTKIIILGRRNLEKNELVRLKSSGVITYIKADLGKKSELDKVWKICEQKFGKINGVFHLAGVIKDSLFRNKDFNSFYQVIYPKMHCTISLSQSLQDKNLDFFFCFSSLSGAIGNIGQSDYASANAFMRHFVISMNKSLLLQQKQPYYYCVDWGLWEKGGMTIPQEQNRLLPLTNDEAFNSLELLIQNKNFYSVIYKGDQGLILKNNNIEYKKNLICDDIPELRTNNLETLISTWIKEVIIKYTKFNDLTDNESIIEKGADSVATINIISDIEKRLKVIAPDVFINKTIIFERYSINLLTKYFLENYQNQLQKLFSTKIADESSKIIVGIHNNLIQEKAYTSCKNQDEVCIVGISGQFPKASNTEEFWQNLITGKNCIQVIPKDRWDWKQFYDPDKNIDGKSYGRHGGFIKSIRSFDSLFFNISPSEAEILDPQERLVLQNVYHAIQDSGLLPVELRNSGVFSSVMFGHYKKYEGNKFTDTSFSSISNRLSYYFDFNGPSISIDTMCSGGLTALHLAVNSIQNDDCEFAIVNGVNLMPHPIKYKILSRGNFLSQNGKCSAFGINADGYVPGEGVISLVLKKTSDAIRDKNYIYGVIKSTAINSGGRSAGYTVPNEVAQKDVIAKALKKSGIDPKDVSCIEAHGTGTKLGDPIEVNALKEIYGVKNSGGLKCAIGSVKSNIGHLESAAGLAGIIKVLCQIKESKIVPTLHCEDVNPLLNLQESRFFLPQKTQEWNVPQNKLKIAGISSFGAGGSNAHVIVSEFHNITERPSVNLKQYIFTLSAKSAKSLQLNVVSFIKWLQGRKDLDLYALSYSLCCTREHHKYRIGFTFEDLPTLKEKLDIILAKDNWNTYKTPNLGQTYKEDSIYVADITSYSDTKIIDRILANYSTGIQIDWKEIFIHKSFIKLPLYEFDKQDYWLEDFEHFSFLDSKKQSNGSCNKNYNLIENMYIYGSEWIVNTIKEGIDIQKSTVIAVNNTSFLDQGLENISVKDFDEESLYKSIDYVTKEDAIENIKIIFEITNIVASNYHRFREYIFNITKNLVSRHYRFDIIFIYECTLDIQEAYLESLSSFYKTIVLESENIKCKLIRYRGENIELLRHNIKHELNYFDLTVEDLLYDHSKRLSKQYLQLHTSTDNSCIDIIKDGGVYFITGGMGKICQILAEDILKRHSAHLVLVGSSALDNKKSDILLRLSKFKGTVEYRKLDITQNEEVNKCITQVIAEYGKINGIIHAAGRTDDQIFFSKVITNFDNIVDIKAEAAIALDEATKNYTSLDFFLLFSSVAAIFGNVGQSDYAMANGFLDAFAERRNSLVDKGLRTGKTISINWPLWESGGMQISQEKINNIADKYGFYPLKDKDGLLFFNYISSNLETFSNSNLITLKGTTAIIDSAFTKSFQI
ncbi:Putative polyketide synthesis protein [Candidatus Megaera polyxenophila]|nr:Putative polyketide synthesis protein [Candidatus Megaera polyxenophila]